MSLTHQTSRHVCTFHNTHTVLTTVSKSPSDWKISQKQLCNSYYDNTVQPSHLTAELSKSILFLFFRNPQNSTFTCHLGSVSLTVPQSFRICLYTVTIKTKDVKQQGALLRSDSQKRRYLKLNGDLLHIW